MSNKHYNKDKKTPLDIAKMNDKEMQKLFLPYNALQKPVPDNLSSNQTEFIKAYI